ncbi:MAG: DNA-directed RNA polymerase subunit beta, partial [Candidatus Hodgkinia cicadicola]
NLIRDLANGIGISCPLFNTSIDKLMGKLNKRLSLSNLNGQIQLYDGITGLPFDRKSTVGIIYIFKLNHLVDDKIHARSTGPCSVVTLQPLKGKTKKGGQRLGEMEVWALQSYGATNTIKEVLTIKCDDVIAKRALYKSLLNTQSLFRTSWSEGLLVLLRELFAMCINVKFK